VQGCIRCHNGVKATHLEVKDADAPIQTNVFGVTINHPVGMNYEYYAGRKQQSYTPRSSLDSAIVLVGGYVTCVSCHRLKDVQNSYRNVNSPWRAQPASGSERDTCTASSELTVGGRQTDLCLACHKM